MKILFTLTIIFIISSVFADTSDNESNKINDCLLGIADTNESVATIAGHLSELLTVGPDELADVQAKLFQDGQLALIKYAKFNPDCRNITEKYTNEQDTILLNGIQPLLSSTRKLYTEILDHLEKVRLLQLDQFLGGFIMAANRAINEFKTWRDSYGSDRVVRATSGVIDDIYYLNRKLQEYFPYFA